jgi:hypothetical protein
MMSKCPPLSYADIHTGWAVSILCEREAHYFTIVNNTCFSYCHRIDLNEKRYYNCEGVDHKQKSLIVNNIIPKEYSSCNADLITYDMSPPGMVLKREEIGYKYSYLGLILIFGLIVFLLNRRM